jgi:hypothetical protein
MFHILQNTFTLNAVGYPLQYNKKYTYQAFNAIDDKIVADMHYLALVIDDADQLQVDQIQALSAAIAAQPWLVLIAIKQPPNDAKSLFKFCFSSLDGGTLLRTLATLQ